MSNKRDVHRESNSGLLGGRQACFPIYHVLTYLNTSFKYDFLDYIGKKSKKKKLDFLEIYPININEKHINKISRHFSLILSKKFGRQNFFLPSIGIVPIVECVHIRKKNWGEIFIWM